MYTNRTERTDNSEKNLSGINIEMSNENSNENITKKGPKTVLTPRSLGMSENTYGNTGNKFINNNSGNKTKPKNTNINNKVKFSNSQNDNGNKNTNYQRQKLIETSYAKIISDKKDSFILNNINQSKTPKTSTKQPNSNTNKQSTTITIQDNYRLDKFNSIIGKIKPTSESNKIALTSSFIKESKEIKNTREKSNTPRNKTTNKNSIIVNNKNAKSTGSGININSTINTTQSTYTSTNESNLGYKTNTSRNKPVKNSLFPIDK